jgi:hypothetical protein
MREAGGAWIGWTGDAGPAPGAFGADGLHLVGLALSESEVRADVPSVARVVIAQARSCPDTDILAAADRAVRAHRLHHRVRGTGPRTEPR